MVWCHTLLQHPHMAWVKVAYHGIWSEFYLLNKDRGTVASEVGGEKCAYH